MPTRSTLPRLHLAGLLLFILFATGCTNLQYGWKQEKEVMKGVPHSIESALKLNNELDQSPCPWLYGIKKECHQAPSIADWRRGYREDIRIWLAR